MKTFPILLLDDEPAAAELLGRALNQEFPQANLISFTSFTGAVAYLDSPITRCPIKLVIVDIDLRIELTGIELIQTLRQHPSCRLAPVVVLSSQSSPDWIEAAYDKGINAYTSKPDSYAGWRKYAAQLRTYWYETVTTPNQSADQHR